MSPLSRAPYYAVIFTSVRTDLDAGYGETSQRMEELAREQPGFLGIDSARSDVGITVSYWRDLDSIHQWKAVAEHALAQRRGRDEWYERYTVRVCRIEYEYGFPRTPAM